MSSRQEPLSLLELYLAHGAVLDSHLLFYAVRSRVDQGELKTRFLLGKGLDPNVTNGNGALPCTSLSTLLSRILLDCCWMQERTPQQYQLAGKTTAKVPRERPNGCHIPVPGRLYLVSLAVAQRPMDVKNA